jgi:ADP-heptose:LPS heptosyltransferase
VVRIAKQQIPNAEIHFLTKSTFRALVEHNPNIDKVLTINKKVNEVAAELKAEQYDFVCDLHTNLRSKRVKQLVSASGKSFEKLNLEKWLLVNFKTNRMPLVHIVDRYLQTLDQFGVKNDNKGLDFFIPDQQEVSLSELPQTHQKGYIGWVIGGSYPTKMFPENKILDVARRLNRPVVLLGGPEDKELGRRIASKLGSQFYNACGTYSLLQSASLVKQAQKILTNDTGLMHIAAAFNKPILSFWGNTVPEFGMTPYLPQNPEKSTIKEVQDLRCRPCSKLGYKKGCPKKHFYCMELIDSDEVATWANEI